MQGNSFSNYIKTPEFMAILKKYETAMSLGESVYMSTEDLVDIADYYHSKMLNDDADKAINYCLQLHPDDSTALLYKARLILTTKGNVGEARRLVSLAENDESGRMNKAYIEAELLIMELKTEEADGVMQREYDKLLANGDAAYYDYEDEDDEPSTSHDISEIDGFCLDAAMLFADYNKTELARKWLGRIHNIGTFKADYLETLGRICLSERQWADAEKHINGLLDIDAYDAQAWLMLCEAQYQQRKYEDALRSTDFALAVERDFIDAHFARGNILMACDRFEEAAESFAKYVEVFPDEPSALLYAASAYYGAMQYDKAAECLAAVESLPLESFQTTEQQLDIIRLGAQIYSMQKQEDKAWACLEKAKGLLPAPEYSFLRAAVNLNLGNMMQALANLEMALMAHQTDLSLLLRIASLCASHKLHYVCTQTLNIIEERIDSLDQLDAYPDFWAYRAVCMRYLEEDTSDRYLQVLQKAVTLAPYDTEVLMGSYFPEGTPVSEYPKIEADRLNKPLGF